MPNLKEIKTRIGSVKKTRQITSAMKLVAAAKLKSATDRATAAQPYQDKLRTVLSRVGQKAGDSVDNPLLQSPDSVSRILLVVLTSDRGLCGGFNNTMLRRAMDWIEDKRSAGIEVSLKIYGRKGRDFLRVRGFDVDDSVIDYSKTPRIELVAPLGDELVQAFADHDADEVWFAYNVFENAASQVPTFSKVLPLTVEESEAADEANLVDYVYEPNAAELLSTLLPLYLRTLVLQAFLETEAGEYGARMLAMDNATRNAGDLIDNLTLQYNRARQAAITTEITEIVSGAEAL
jgi:F-type H+-transporting ATPase subunit gamma